MKNTFRKHSKSWIKRTVLLGLIVVCCFTGMRLTAQVAVQTESQANVEGSGSKWVLVIHGGAGGPARGSMTDDREKEYIARLNDALAIGSRILDSGGSSLDAVEAVVKFMEDCPLFNAGLGAVLNENGKAELDASIMDGRTGMAGAVAAVTTVKNPVSAARMVMEKTDHVMLVGKGAEDFVKTHGVKLVDPLYFITPERYDAWKKWKSDESERKSIRPDEKGKQGGTVGAVALDNNGNLAAATSTGGMMGKMAGRVGDSPIIGAGTYANNNTCAVSATGHGEYFIRNVVAYDLSALIEYGKMSLPDAAKFIVMEKLVGQRATGGLIAVDKKGEIAMPFNTNAMFRGYAKATGEKEVNIY